MRTSAKLITALSVAGIAVAAGSAFTAGNTFAAGSTVPLGYSTTTVSGATVNSLDYNLSAAGNEIDSATLVLDGNTATSTVQMGFNGGSLFGCVAGGDVDPLTTVYTCTPVAPLNTSALVSTVIVVN